MKISNSSLKQILLSTLCALTVSVLQADILANFNFDASSLASADASTSWDSSDLSNGTGVPMTIVTGPVNEGGGSPDEYVSDDLPAIGMQYSSFDYDNIADSLAANGYYSFTVEPDAGTQLTFTDITFDLYKTFGTGKTLTVTIFSSIDGFSTTGDAIGADDLVGDTTESGVSLGRTVDLSTLSSVSTITEFRLYVDHGGAGNTNNFLGLDNIILNGTVAAIPEPSTALLVVGGLFASLLFSRKRTSK